MSIYLAEFLGTALLVLLGDGVVANCILKKTGGNGGGLIAITVGWAFAVVIPALIFGPTSGGHFNPALTIALAVTQGFASKKVAGYIACQMGGAIVGAVLVYIHYKQQFDATDDADTKRAVFCTAPTIRNTVNNFISEFIGTFVLVFGILGVTNTAMVPGLGTFAVGGIILVIGLTLGGPTGYAINPARDLGPRIAHAFLPIKDKQGSNWWYAWIPVVAPICGALVAGWAFNIWF